MTDGPVEGTKLAVDGACIGVIHVPVDEVRDLATGNLLLPSKQSRSSAHEAALFRTGSPRPLATSARPWDPQASTRLPLENGRPHNVTLDNALEVIQLLWTCV